MQFTTFGKMIDSRGGRCIYCGRKFATGDTGAFVPTGVSIWVGRVHPLKGKEIKRELQHGYRIRKISMTVPVDSKLMMTMSMVNDGLRIRGLEKDKWLTYKANINCQNARHYHAMDFKYSFNLYSMKTKDIVLETESIKFKNKGSLYSVAIDWLNMTTTFTDTGSGGKVYNKPNVLTFSDREDLIRKIDRLILMK